MGIDRAATIDQAVIELTQGSINAMLGGPTGPIGDYIDGLHHPHFHALHAVDFVGIGLRRERKRGIRLKSLNWGARAVQFATGPNGSSPGPAVQLRATFESPTRRLWNGFRLGLVAAATPSDFEYGADFGG